MTSATSCAIDASPRRPFALRRFRTRPALGAACHARRFTPDAEGSRLIRALVSMMSLLLTFPTHILRLVTLRTASTARPRLASTSATDCRALLAGAATTSSHASRTPARSATSPRPAAARRSRPTITPPWKGVTSSIRTAGRTPSLSLLQLCLRPGSLTILRLVFSSAVTTIVSCFW